jgi:hypothetical protein
LYGLGSTPETIVISSQGKVVERWLGAYEGGTKRDMERFFSANLPDAGR